MKMTLKLNDYEKTEIFRLVKEISEYHGGYEFFEKTGQPEYNDLIIYIEELISKAYDMGEYDESIRGERS
jgi:hypothetical protein